MRSVPLDTWMVVEPIASDSMRPVSLHTTQEEAERERDRRNRQLEEPRYAACIVLQPIAERMGCPSRIG
jgi:hypothetical protein